MAQPNIVSQIIIPESLTEAVSRMTGRAATADLERQIMIVVTLLGARLDEVDREAVAERVDPALRATMLRPMGLDASAEAFEAAIQGRVNQNVARATCTALAEAMDEQGRCHLRLQPLRSWLLLRTS